MSVPASSLSPLSSQKLKKNTLVLFGRVVALEKHKAVFHSKEVYLYRIQLESPDGFSAGSRHCFVAPKKDWEIGADFEETVSFDNCYRRYETKAGEVVRESFPTSCFFVPD